MKIIFSLLIALISTTAVIGQSADDILGVWYNQEKTGKVEVFKKGDKYFGKIIWLKEPMRDGAPKLDIENSDEKLRTQPIMGLEILKGFEFDDDEWEEGTIYDPKNGETYSCVITKEGNSLNVRGYIGFSFIGRTSIWTKAE
ncbi:MAG TPA: DUF2147 domain-containing protein [Flavobacteriales bacterium]|jgi:uncharacterized protein (DUF2147 family)|nr:DUF2147 domain-containing protein [Flavobacteriales bacterium]